jgi:hypothetical protein
MSAVGLPVMAKKRRVPNTENWKMKTIIAQLRGSVEFKEWLEKAAKVDRSSVAMFLERAVVHYAKTIGYSEAAPER